MHHHLLLLLLPTVRKYSHLLADVGLTVSQVSRNEIRDFPHGDDRFLRSDDCRDELSDVVVFMSLIRVLAGVFLLLSVYDQCLEC
jgi:hypothetical protein